MRKGLRFTLLGIVVVVIVVSISYLEPYRPSSEEISGSEIRNESEDKRVTKKGRLYDTAKDISSPDHFINSEPFSLRDYIGDKVILVDFWTYSCINCQRTLPYLNAWHDKYADKGLLIVGVHTPEFEFEKKLENVKKAAERFGIKYPIVMDNDYSTWLAYKNRFWPRKYIIGVDGFIRYDHIGEGAYDETEEVIQDLLEERMEVLGEENEIEKGIVDVEDTSSKTRNRSPEVYFGASRNELLENGMKNMAGKQSLNAEEPFELNALQLEGMWNIQPEFSELEGEEGRIVFRYRAKDVFMVASSEKPVKMRVFRDGKPIDFGAGEDVEFDKAGAFIRIQEEKLYKIVQDPKGAGKHLLELKFDEPGMQAFTFTFG